MGTFYYGTRVFSKLLGYYGEAEECPVCHRTYQKGYVKYNKWAHLNFIPIIPTGKRYYAVCPICGNDKELDKKEAKAVIKNTTTPSNQSFNVYAKHIMANKPKGILADDTSYELWVKDLVSNEEVCVATDFTKDTLKDMKLERGLKKIKIIKV